MTDKEKKSKIADILMDFQEEYSNEVINRPMLASLYAGNILSFIDSLQEEPVSKDFEMALTEMVAKAQKCVVEPWVVAAQWKDELIKLAKSEEPVSEELEKAAVEAFKQIVDSDKNNFLEIFKAGAKWQKAKDESTTEDLGEYINELSKQFPEVSFAKLSRIAVRVAKWQKEQMIAKAIDAEVLENYDGKVIKYDEDALDEKLSNCNVFDKVKVVVINED